MFIRTQIPLLVILVLISSCSPDEQPDMPPPVQEQPEEPQPLYEELVDEMHEYPDCMIDDEPCVKIHFQYPDFIPGNTLADSLRTWTQKRLFDLAPDTSVSDRSAQGADAASLAEEWFRDYEQFLSEIEDYRIPWALERRVRLIFESEDIVTLHFSEFSFTGGAHPMQIDHFRSFDRENGQIIRLDDLTIDDRHFHQLVELAEEQFRFTYELLESDNLEDAGYHFLNGRFHLTENFAFTEFGLLFYFNTYEVAPYSSAPISIEIPYEDLEHLVRPGWLTDRQQLTL